MCFFSFSKAHGSGEAVNQHRKDRECSRQLLQPVATPGLKDVPLNRAVSEFTEQHARGEAALQAACSRAKVQHKHLGALT